MKLNLGCGLDIKRGYVNLDSQKLENVNVVANIDKKLPFKDNTFDEILAFNILEHCKDVVATMKEIYRISKDEAIIKIIVPHFTSSGSWGDLTHQRTFSYNSFNYFDKTNLRRYKRGKFFGYEYGSSFKIIKKKIIFRKAYLFLSRIFNTFPNFYQDTALAYLFPARGVYVELECLKRN